MENIKCTTEENEARIEAEVASYKLARMKKKNQEKAKRRLENNPNYAKEVRARYRDKRREYEKARRKDFYKYVPKELVLDIRRWRDRRCLTVKGFADRVGISVDYAKHILYGKKKPSVRILSFLGLDWDFNREVKEYKSVYKQMCRSKSSICFDCSAKNCSWISIEQPVDGWNAEKTKVNLGKSYGIVDSYFVIGCPLYKDKWEE